LADGTHQDVRDYGLLRRPASDMGCDCNLPAAAVAGFLMAAEHWFRWHHGTVTDPKWRVVASRCVTFVTVGHVVAVWAAMIENASQSSPRGELSGWDDEDVAVCLGFEIEQVAAIRQAMQGKVLDGNALTSWEKRQPNREDRSTERTKAWRDRQREQRDESKRDVTNGDASKRTVTLETETETEKKELKAKSIERQAARFDEFWAMYPVKKGRSDAEAKWKARGLDAIADRIISDVKARKQRDRQWLDGYAPHGSTYVNGCGWEDEIEEGRPNAKGGLHAADDAWATAQ
jgi:hypothetical protein